MSVFTKRIDADIRDTDHTFDKDTSTWSIDASSAWNVGNPGFVLRNIGLRFISVNISKNSTINSAKITFVALDTKSVSLVSRIQGIAQDNTGEFVLSPEDSARTRTKTTAVVSWNATVSETTGNTFDSPDIKTIVQELVNRAGWSSGNAMAFYLSDNGSGDGEYLSVEEYGDDGSGSAICALLTIDYTETSSISPSLSPSISPSTSPSSSLSPSGSASPSQSPSISISPSVSISPSKSPSLSPSLSPSVSPSSSMSPSPPDYGIKIKKQSVNKDVEDITDPKELVFTSGLGVLGLRLLDTVTAITDASGNINTTDNHGIGYPPITIVTVEAYDGNRVVLPTEWHSFYQNVGHETIEVTEDLDFTVDGTKIRLIVHAEEFNLDTEVTTMLSGRSYTFKIYYYFNEIVETTS